MADFTTVITVKGTTEELFNILKRLVDYTDKSSGKPYLGSVDVSNKDNQKVLHFTDLRLTVPSNEEIEKAAISLDGAMEIVAAGPYGRFGILEEVPLLEDLAEAAPHCTFVGEIEGFNAGGDQEEKGELKNGRLHLYYMLPHDDEDWDDDDDDNFDEEDEIEWDEEAIYDPINKEYEDEE